MNYRLGVISCQYWQYALNSVLRELWNLSKGRDLYGSSNPTQMLSPFTICLSRSHQPYVKYLWHWILIASSGGSFCLPTALTRWTFFIQLSYKSPSLNSIDSSLAIFEYLKAAVIASLSWASSYGMTMHWHRIFLWITPSIHSYGEGNGTLLQYSCLENPMDFTFTFHFHALEKEMATCSSVLAWRIPGTGEPDGLPSMGSHRVRHDWSDLAAAVAAYTVKWNHILHKVGLQV